MSAVRVGAAADEKIREQVVKGIPDRVWEASGVQLQGRLWTQLQGVVSDAVWLLYAEEIAERMKEVLR